MTDQTPSPIRDSVGAALRFTRAHWAFVFSLAGIGAAATVVLAVVASAGGAFAFLGAAAETGVRALIYAAFTAAVLTGVSSVRADWLVRGARVWAALIVTGFFLFIVIFVVSIPVMITLIAGPLSSYVPDLQAAGGDQDAVQTTMVRFFEENPITTLLITLFYAAIWMYLTSRLYFAVPASVEQRRVLTFETWNSTKGFVLTIIGARLMLIFPAILLSAALGELVGRFTEGAGSPGLLVHAFASAFVAIAVVAALEAPLSVALYRDLRPAEIPRPGL